MDKRSLILSLSEQPEDQILLARIWDRISNGIRRNIPASTCFLSGREQHLADQMFRQSGSELPLFFGGPENAERRVAVYIPNYYEPELYLNSEEGPVSALRVSFSEYDSLTHRDFLGSLMGQGIKRETLGDIYPQRQF